MKHLFFESFLALAVATFGLVLLPPAALVIPVLLPRLPLALAPRQTILSPGL